MTVQFDPAKHCGGKTRAGGPCCRPKGWGTDHAGTGACKLHLGSTQNHRRAAEREMARIECDRLGVPIEVDPGDALMQELWEAAGNVAFYRSLVQELPTHPAPDEYQPPQSDNDPGHWERGEPGIYGRAYHVSGVPTGEAKPHVLVALYNEERKRLADVAAAALRAGVEERRVRLAEDQAAQLARVIAAILTDLGHDLTEPGVREVVRLRLIEGGKAA